MNQSTLQIEIGKVPVSLTLESGHFEPETWERYRPFLSSRKAQYRLLLRKSARRVSSSPWLPNVSLGEGPENISWLRCTSSDFVWDMGLKSRSGKGYFKDSPQAFDSVLRSLYSAVLPLRSGILLHAAALVRRGGAYLFVGPSGAGKTTLIRKLMGGKGIEPLSDELTLVKGGIGKCFAHATPFWGEFRMPGLNGSAPLRKIFWLVKSKSGLRRVPLSRTQAQSKLLKCLIHFSSGGELLEKSWDFLSGVIQSIPVEEFRWDKNDATDSITEMIQ